MVLLCWRRQPVGEWAMRAHVPMSEDHAHGGMYDFDVEDPSFDGWLREPSLGWNAGVISRRWGSPVMRGFDVGRDFQMVFLRKLMHPV